MSVRRLDPADAPRVVDVLCDAFRAYPVMRYVLGEGEAGEGRRLHRLVTLFVMARAMRGEPLLGVEEGGRLVAAATMSRPGHGEAPAEWLALRDEVWAELGADARARYDTAVAAWQTLVFPEPHLHVNMIGVGPAHRGRGLARLLLEHGHGISRATDGSTGVSLTTEDPRNVDFYRHMGYEVVGQVRIAPELETWGLFVTLDGDRLTLQGRLSRTTEHVGGTSYHTEQEMEAVRESLRRADVLAAEECAAELALALAERAIEEAEGGTPRLGGVDRGALPGSASPSETPAEEGP